MQALSGRQVEIAFGEQRAHHRGAGTGVDGGGGLHAVDLDRDDDVMGGIGLKGDGDGGVGPRCGAGRAILARQQAHRVAAEIEVEIEIAQEIGRDGAREMIDPGAALLRLQHEAHAREFGRADLQRADRHETVEHGAVGHERLLAFRDRGGREVERACDGGRQRGERAARIDHEGIVLPVDGDGHENGQETHAETGQRSGAAIFGVRGTGGGRHREGSDG